MWNKKKEEKEYQIPSHCGKEEQKKKKGQKKHIRFTSTHTWNQQQGSSSK
jgi:hypothetical protein